MIGEKARYSRREEPPIPKAAPLQRMEGISDTWPAASRARLTGAERRMGWVAGGPSRFA